MNKSQLISTIAESAGMPLAQAEKVLQSALNGIVESLKKGQDVVLMGFGSFKTKKRSARKVRNLQTGVEMTLAPCIVPYFKSGKTLKDSVDGK